MGNKPEIIMMDTGGFNAQNLEETRTRLIKGNSWKQQRIIVILPSADLIPAKVSLSHWNLQFPPNQSVVKLLCLGQEVGSAYSSAIESILADPNLSKFDYILTIEHDNVIPYDAVTKLLKRMDEHPEFAAIQALYFLKGPGSPAQIWGSPQQDPVINFRPQPPRADGGIIETYGTANGCTLFRMEIFKDERIKRPWFKTEPGVTQDLNFWMEAKKYGWRCCVDCSIVCGHYDLKGDFGIPDFCW